VQLETVRHFILRCAPKRITAQGKSVPSNGLISISVERQPRLTFLALPQFSIGPPCSSLSAVLAIRTGTYGQAKVQVTAGLSAS
jgi:hypothetical protein